MCYGYCMAWLPQVVGVVREECLGEFESPLIEELVSSVQERITNWVAQIYGEGEVVVIVDSDVRD